MLTPENVHYNLADEVVSKRQIVLDQIFERFPQRFVNGKPNLKCLIILFGLINRLLLKK